MRLLFIEPNRLQGVAHAATECPPPPRSDPGTSPHTRACPSCGGPPWSANKAQRTVTTLLGLIRLRLPVRSCRNPGCPRRGACLRPEQEGGFSLPQHEFGLDVIALIGRLRHAEHRSLPEIRAELARRGVLICLRGVGNLLDRYDELLAPSTQDGGRLRAITAAAGRVILALDGVQPDVGREVLWVLRDVLSGEVLLARSLLSSTQGDRAKLIAEVKAALPVPIAGVVSDGQSPIRKAVAEALDGVPHQLCQFHYLREAALPVDEADRPAKVQLKKKVRGIRPIERKVEGRQDDEAETIRGYCAAVRSSLTDDGRPPLEASGLKLRDRPAKVAGSLDRLGARRGSRGNRRGCGRSWERAWRRRPRCGPRCGWPSGGSGDWPRSWPTERGADAAAVRRRYRGVIAALARACRPARSRQSATVRSSSSKAATIAWTGQPWQRGVITRATRSTDFLSR